MLHLVLGNALSSVADAQYNVVVVLVGGGTEGDGASRCCVFCRIGEQVEEYLVQLVGVYPSHHACGLALNIECQPLAVHQWQEAACRLLDELHDVAIADQQLQFAGL